MAWSAHRLFLSGMLLYFAHPLLAYQRCMSAALGLRYSLSFSTQRTKPIHVKTACISLPEHVYVLFGLRMDKGNPDLAKSNPNTQVWASGVINTKLDIFSLSRLPP